MGIKFNKLINYEGIEPFIKEKTVSVDMSINPGAQQAVSCTPISGYTPVSNRFVPSDALSGYILYGTIAVGMNGSYYVRIRNNSDSAVTVKGSMVFLFIRDGLIE